MINDIQEILIKRSDEVRDSFRECLADLTDMGYEISVQPLDAKNSIDPTTGQYSSSYSFERGYWVVRLIKPNYKNLQNHLGQDYFIPVSEQFSSIDIREIATSVSFFISYIQDSTEFEVSKMQPYLCGEVAGRTIDNISFSVDRNSNGKLYEPLFWKNGRSWISALYSEIGHHMYFGGGMDRSFTHSVEIKAIDIFLSDKKLSHLFLMREYELKKNPPPPVRYVYRESWFRRLINWFKLHFR